MPEPRPRIEQGEYMPSFRLFSSLTKAAASLGLIIAIALPSLSDSGAKHARVVSQPSSQTKKAAKKKGVPAPLDVIGFTPGDDRKLASWAQMTDYFNHLARASNRVKVQELGRTTLGRPFLLATISSPENLARLPRFKEIQRRLADPRLINSDQREAEKLIAEGRTIVLITCGIHSTEVGGNLAALNIAYRLASDDSNETREILDKCIVLLVPSLNPDGVDIVKDWYDKTLGTPSEGTGPPDLYHYYVGHDNNRDWYAFTQVETRLTVDKVHNEWHPQIVHDIHQQGATGSRFFLPPYVDPWEPNVPPIIQAGVNFMGSAMAWELIGQGKAGVVINGVYDAWTPARAYQHYHGGIRILSETASARLASPTSVDFDKQTPQVNLDPKVRSWNYPKVWQGGEWKLADIVDYMQSGAFALLRNAARYRERWLRDFYQIGKDAVRERKPEEMFAYLLLPPDASGDGEDGAHFWQEYGLARIESILNRGGVEISRSLSAFEADGNRFPAGTRIILIGQPYGAFAKTLLERQHYPDLREYPGGPPRRPYDVTAHTLPLLMGASAVAVGKRFDLPPVEKVSTGDSEVSKVIAKLGPPKTEGPGADDLAPRLAVYKNYATTMDEGWTRWMLDQFKPLFRYSSLVDKEIRAGDLRKRFDCIIIPDQSARQINDGLPKAAYPADVSGGMGREGVESLKRFVEEGGTIITFNDASEFAIGQLGVPVKNVLDGIPAKDFYCPGSILKIEFKAAEPLTKGAPPLDGKPDEGIAWFERGPAFETTSADARVVARFADAKELLLSGWLLGAEKLAGRGAIVEAKLGKGRVIMFAFRPQYRGQSTATLPFLFNAIQTSANP